MVETITTSLRVPEAKNDYIKEKAQEIGISQNAFMMVLLDLGIKTYEAQAVINLQQK